MKRLLTIAASLTLLTGVMTACGGGNAEFNDSRSINVTSREDGSGTRGAFIELFEIEEKSADGSRRDLTTTSATIANKTDIMLTTISQDLYAIGYVSLGSLNNSVTAVDIDGQAATSENVRNGSYEIFRPFNIVTKGEAGGVAQDFINFILSKEGQEVVSDNYIAVNDNAESFTSDGSSGKIVVAGSSSVAPVMEKLIEAYEKINSDASIELQANDSTSGINGTIDGIADIGMSSRDLKEDEAAQLNAIEIALDGLAVIVHKDNPLTNLSAAQVAEIFKGNVKNWEDVIE